MSSEEREQEELEVVGEVQGGDPSGAPTTADPESAVLIASYVAEQQHDVTLFERDEATGVHDVYSELTPQLIRQREAMLEEQRLRGEFENTSVAFPL